MKQGAKEQKKQQQVRFSFYAHARVTEATIYPATGSPSPLWTAEKANGSATATGVWGPAGLYLARGAPLPPTFLEIFQLVGGLRFGSLWGGKKH